MCLKQSTTTPASRASPVVVVLDLIVAKQTDLITALAWPEVLVSHVHVLHAEWAACHVRDASDPMADFYKKRPLLTRRPSIDPIDRSIERSIRSIRSIR